MRSPAAISCFPCAGSGASAATIWSTSRKWGRTSASRRSFFPSPPTPSCRTARQCHIRALKGGGRFLKAATANDLIWGYGVGIDLTRRDLQIASRDIKRPWEIGKAFDSSAPCGPLASAAKTGHPAKGRITLKCNGQLRQDGDLAQMIWNVPEVIEKLSEMVALAAGDIIMTGTPSGVAATVAGDKLECEVEGVGKLTVTMGPALK